MCDVRLGVKFLLVVNAALDLAGTNCFDDARYTFQKVVGLLLLFEGIVELLQGTITNTGQ